MNNAFSFLKIMNNYRHHATCQARKRSELNSTSHEMWCPLFFSIKIPAEPTSFKPRNSTMKMVSWEVLWINLQQTYGGGGGAYCILLLPVYYRKRRLRIPSSGNLVDGESKTRSPPIASKSGSFLAKRCSSFIPFLIYHIISSPT